MNALDLPPHIRETPRGSLVCTCGQGMPLKTIWPKTRPKVRAEFVERHAVCAGNLQRERGREAGE